MRRPILMTLLALGALAGFGSGFAELHHARARCAAAHRAELDEACNARTPSATPPAESPK